MNRILFTGGGSAGHVTVNIALIPHFLETGWKVDYIGSADGIENQLISNIKMVSYHAISTGKLRRYFDWNNFKDPFKVMKGVLQAYRLIRKIKPDVIFSKGGFVSVPVIIGGWLNKVPIIIHESDMTPGLANKISTRFATKVCVTFPETMKHFEADKVIHVGPIVREELKQGNTEQGLAFCNFSTSKPVLLIIGGSLGSQRLNQMVRNNLDQLLSRFQIVHLCGKGQVDPSLNQEHYRQFEYVTNQLADLLAMADFVVSRAGSNAIFELLTLQKPMLLIPLSRQASRGDQILNAQSFKKAGYCEMLFEEELTDDVFISSIFTTYDRRDQLIQNMRKSQGDDARKKVIDVILQTSRLNK